MNVDHLTRNPDRPLPTLTEWDEEYWQAAKEGRLLVQACGSCDRVRHFPRAMCPTCGSFEHKWLESEGRGIIYSWTILRRQFHHGFTDLPLMICIVALDDYPEVHLLSNLVGWDETDESSGTVAIGDSVRVEFETFGDVVLPQFSLV